MDEETICQELLLEYSWVIIKVQKLEMVYNSFSRGGGGEGKKSLLWKMFWIMWKLTLYGLVSQSCQVFTEGHEHTKMGCTRAEHPQQPLPGAPATFKIKFSPPLKGWWIKCKAKKQRMLFATYLALSLYSGHYSSGLSSKQQLSCMVWALDRSV